MQNGSAIPKPLNQNISLYQGYEGRYAVGSFGGFAVQASVVAAASALAGNLTADGIAYGSQLYSLIYNDPLT